MVSDDEIKRKLKAKREEIGSPKENSVKSTEKKTNVFSQIKSWWNKRSKKGKAATGVIAFCFGIILVGAVVGIIFFDETLAIAGNTPGHYEGKVFSFNYPDDWNINDKYSTDDIVMVMPVKDQLTDGGALIDVTFVTYPRKFSYFGQQVSPQQLPSNLDGYKEDIINSENYVYINDTLNHTGNTTVDPNFKIISDKPVNINGLNGFDLTIQHTIHYLGGPTEIIEYVVLQNGTRFYEFELEGATNDTFIKLHNDFMTMVNSLKIK